MIHLKALATRDEAEEDIFALASCYRSKWQEKDDSYWLQRLMQEVGELASVLADDHPDTVEHELKQIGSIALNWLRKRDREVDDDT